MRIPVLPIAILLLTGGLHAAPPPEAADTEPAWKQTLLKKLSHIVHFKLPDSTFKDAKEYFEKELLHSPIVVDRLASEKESQLELKPISMESPEQGMSLQSALTLLARAVNLQWTLRDEMVVFTTEEGLGEPNELRVYDVHDLLVTIQDFIGPTIGMEGGAGGPGIVLDKTQDAAEDEKLTGESLIEFIKETVNNPARDLWEKQGGSIQFRNGRLFVNASPTDHRQIERLLSSLRDSRRIQITIQARAFSMDLETWKSIQGKAAMPPSFLDDAQAKALEEAAASGSASILEQCQSTCFNTQRTSMGSLRNRAYVRDQAAVVQNASTGMDPEIGYFMEGLLVDVRPVLQADMQKFLLELRSTLVGSVGPLRSQELAPASEDKEKGKAGRSLVELPDLQHNYVRTSVVVPDGRMAVFTGSSILAGPKDKRILVLVVQAGLATAE